MSSVWNKIYVAVFQNFYKMNQSFVNLTSLQLHILVLSKLSRGSRQRELIKVGVPWAEQGVEVRPDVRLLQPLRSLQVYSTRYFSFPSR